MIEQLFSIIAPVLICVAIGYCWARWGRRYDIELVTTLITSVGAPCLVLHTLANLRIPVGALATVAAAATMVIALCMLVGVVFLHLVGWPQRAFLPALMFANTGNMGLPLSFLAFGDNGLGLAIGIFAVHSTLMFTVGSAIAAGKPSLRSLVRMPLLYAVALSLIFLLTGTTPPDFVNATARLLGGITIPMMLITLGVSLGKLRIASLPRSMTIAVLRLVFGFAAAFACARLLHLDGVAASVLILQATMPVAVFNYLFAQRYDTKPEEVAGIVVISTLLSFLTLPLLLWYVL